MNDGKRINRVKIEKSDMNYLESVTELAWKNYEKECRSVPKILGAKKEDLCRELRKMFDKETILLCIEQEELVGFLGYYHLWEKGDQLFCTIPFWGYGAAGTNRAKVLSYLFQSLADQLSTKEKVHFEIKIYAHDEETIRLFSFLQFGILCEEGSFHCPLEKVLSDETQVLNLIRSKVKMQSQFKLREITAEEKVYRWPEIWSILQQLIRHLQKSPVFYKGEEFTEEVYQSYLMEENTKVLIAEKQDRIIGILCAGKDGNSFLNNDKNWYNIGDLYVDSNYRGSGLAQLLLTEMIRSLEESGFEKFWVEHGTANPNARGFWNKYFASYLYTMTRVIERW